MQEQDIDRVADMVVNSTEDVKAANEDIREVIIIIIMIIKTKSFILQ